MKILTLILSFLFIASSSAGLISTKDNYLVGQSNAHSNLNYSGLQWLSFQWEDENSTHLHNMNATKLNEFLAEDGSGHLFNDGWRWATPDLVSSMLESMGNYYQGWSQANYTLGMQEFFSVFGTFDHDTYSDDLNNYWYLYYNTNNEGGCDKQSSINVDKTFYGGHKCRGFFRLLGDGKQGYLSETWGVDVEKSEEASFQSSPYGNIISANSAPLIVRHAPLSISLNKIVEVSEPSNVAFLVSLFLIVAYRRKI